MIKDIKSNQIESLKKDSELMLLQVYSDTCQPCKIALGKINTIVDDLGQYLPNVDLKVYKLNGKDSENFTFIQKEAIRVVPTFFLYKDGELVDKNIGTENFKTISEIQKYINEKGEL